MNASKQKRILIVDDHPIVRAGLRQMIETNPGLIVNADVPSIAEARQQLESELPDLVILDLLLKHESGLDLLKEWKSHYPNLKVLVISMMDEDVYAERALRAGASGFVMKEEATERLQEAIETVLSGELYLNRRVAMRLVDRGLRPSKDDHNERSRLVSSLTDRELHVFQLIGSGLKTSAIAKKLTISPKTVEAHKEHIKNKIGLQSAAELARVATLWVNGD